MEAPAFIIGAGRRRSDLRRGFHDRGQHHVGDPRGGVDVQLLHDVAVDVAGHRHAAVPKAPGSFWSPRYRFRPARAIGLDRRSHQAKTLAAEASVRLLDRNQLVDEAELAGWLQAGPQVPVA